MFSTNTHYQLHAARQSELEADAQRYRIASKVAKENGDILRKRIGAALITLGQKLVQESEQDIQLAFSAQQ